MLRSGLIIEGSFAAALPKVKQVLDDWQYKPDMRRAIKPILDEVKNRAPVDTGNLKKNITMTVKQSKRNKRIYIAMVVVSANPTLTIKGGTKLNAARDLIKEAKKREAIKLIVQEYGSVNQPGKGFIVGGFKAAMSQSQKDLENIVSTSIIKPMEKLIGK